MLKSLKFKRLRYTGENTALSYSPWQVCGMAMWSWRVYHMFDSSRWEAVKDVDTLKVQLWRRDLCRSRCNQGVTKEQSHIMMEEECVLSYRVIASNVHTMAAVCECWVVCLFGRGTLTAVDCGSCSTRSLPSLPASVISHANRLLLS